MDQNWLDIQHRGYRSYLQETQDATATKAFSRSVIPIPGQHDRMDTTLYDCKIDLQWVEKAEQALPFLDNALKEARQFILRHGEIVPIEKTRRVSRESVEHLSRHSELIARLPEPGEILTPDKLYMTENVGTYAVYENRFLYMLLRELQDFLSYRYRKIREITEAFSAELEFFREFSDFQRRIRYHLHYQEFDQTPEELANPATRHIIGRISVLLQEVDRMLKTPLMAEVSAAPLLRPPITRTNVLLHNPNFVAAFELYTFLSEYQGEGFETVERQRSADDPLSQANREVATLVGFTSYLSHRWSGLLDILEERFAAEEALRQKQADLEEKARLSQLKARIGDSAESALAYMQALEKRNEALETYHEQIEAAKALHQEALLQLEQTVQIQGKLQGQISLLESTVADKEHLIFQADLEKKQLQAAMHQLQEQENARIETLRKEFEHELQQQKTLFFQEYEALAEKLRLENALTHAREGSECDLSSREAFAELEAEYAAFRRFYRQQWKAAKQHIRQAHLKKPD